MSTSNVPDPADWIELVSQFSIFFPNTGKRKHHVSSRTWKRISMLESRCTWLVHSYVLLQKRQGRIYYDCYVLGFEMQSFFSLKVSSLYRTLVGDNRMMKEETKRNEEKNARRMVLDSTISLSLYRYAYSWDHSDSSFLQQGRDFNFVSALHISSNPRFSPSS